MTGKELLKDYDKDSFIFLSIKFVENHFIKKIVTYRDKEEALKDNYLQKTISNWYLSSTIENTNNREMVIEINKEEN